MKKIIAAVMALMILCACALAESALPMEFPGAFAHPSNEFSMATAFKILSSFMPQGEDEAKAMFAAQGFEVIKQDHYGKPLSDHSHTSGYTLAAGQMEIQGEMRNAAVITIRGTADGEWYSNFDFAGEKGSEAMYAENFMAASQDIFDGVKAEISAMENPVIIATGYSRGAACANLIGPLLTEAYGAENVYVYTFATPNTIRGQHPFQKNIFNLVNVNDMITSMPPAQWDFARHGTDIELRDENVINTTMHMMFMEMLGLCPDIDSYYNVRHSLTGYGLSDDGATAFEMFTLVAGALTGEEGPSAQLSQMMEAAATNPNDFTATLMLFMGAGGEAEGYSNQHMPDVYVDIMTKMAGY